MAGILILALFLFSGMLIGESLPGIKDKAVRLWIGSVFGMMLMMVLPCLLAFLYGFTEKCVYISCAFCFFTDILMLIRMFRKKESRGGFCTDPRVLWYLIPTALFFAYLQYTHYFRCSDGALFVGQSTYGDICMHSAIITSLPGTSFPPDYSILPGSRLGYPFFSDALSAVMYMFGTPLSLSMTIPGTLMGIEIFAGFAFLAYRITKSRKAAVIAFLIFFLNGGLGFIYSFDLIGEDPTAFYNIFTEYYAAPANQPAYNLRFVNILCDMMLPQRTFSAGIMVLLPALYILYDAISKDTDRQYLSHWVLLGVWAGFMPMIHTHSFLSLGIMTAGAMAYLFIQNRSVRSLRNFLIYGIIAISLALPQLIIWTFPQTGTAHALSFAPGWVNNENGFLRDETIWFWLKNLGLPLLFIPGGILGANKAGKALSTGAVLAFVIANLVRFQILLYDNNKIMYASLLILYPLAAKYMCDLYDTIRHLPARQVLACFVMTVCLLAGSLSCVREAVSNYMIFSSDEVKAGEFLSAETEKGCVVLSGRQHNNLASVLSGKTLVCGASNFLYTHGLDYSAQEKDLKLMFEEPGLYEGLYRKYNVSYVMISDQEKRQFDIDTEWFRDHCECVYSNDSVMIFAYDG